MKTTVNLRPSPQAIRERAQLVTDLAHAQTLAAAGDVAGARRTLARHGLSYIAVEVNATDAAHARRIGK